MSQRHRCAQCNDEDGLEQRCAVASPDGGVVEVWLHRECESHWLGDRKGFVDDPGWVADAALAIPISRTYGLVRGGMRFVHRSRARVRVQR